MRRGLVAIASLSLGLTACGSTVAQTSQGALPGSVAGSPDGLGQSGVAPLDAASGVGGGTSGTSSAVPGGTGTGPLVTAGSGGGPGPAGAPGSVGSPSVDYTRPATGAPVEVGMMYIADLGAAAAQFGAGGGQNNEAIDGQREYMYAAVEWMNAHGGLGGHKIKLLLYGAQIAGSKSYEQSQSEMCAMMTEDHKAVAAIISNITVTNTMAQCMEKARGLFVTDAGYFKSARDWRSLTYTVSPSELDSEILGRDLANLTIAKGAARKGDKVGLVVYDAPGYRAAEAQYTAVAKASGIETMSYRLTYANSTAELSNSIAAVQSAVLAFQSAGVKTVVSLSSGGMMGFFMGNADNQQYYPRYVFSSNDGPVNAPAAAKHNQLKGAITHATLPTMDVDLLAQPALFSDPTFSTCRQINKQLPASRESLANFNISQRLCMSLLLVQTAAKGSGGSDITGTTLRDGLRRVGSGISAGATYRSLFAPGKQWAPSYYRSMHYDEAQNRFVYDSDYLPLS